MHPGSLPGGRKIIVDLKKPIKEILGDSRAEGFESEQIHPRAFRPAHRAGILGTRKTRPRPEFNTATFADGVEVSDLRPGMILEGVVTNVAAFGAFVDIGVHPGRPGHVSALSNTFVKDPHTVVKAGQIVKVKVL